MNRLRNLLAALRFSKSATKRTRSANFHSESLETKCLLSAVDIFACDIPSTDAEFGFDQESCNQPVQTAITPVIQSTAAEPIVPFEATSTENQWQTPTDSAPADFVLPESQPLNWLDDLYASVELGLDEIPVEEEIAAANETNLDSTDGILRYAELDELLRNNRADENQADDAIVSAAPIEAAEPKRTAELDVSDVEPEVAVDQDVIDEIIQQLSESDLLEQLLEQE